MKIASPASRVILKSVKIGLTISIIYFLFTTYNWMVFEKYQLEGNIKGIDAQVDKDLGLDKKCELAYTYEKAWIDAEKKIVYPWHYFPF